MKETDVIDYARRLYQAHGGKAEAEAAQKEAAARKDNNDSEADDWARIRVAIREMRD